jgi:hypothetical protein
MEYIGTFLSVFQLWSTETSSHVLTYKYIPNIELEVITKLISL